MSKEFNAKAFLERVEALADTCETEEEARELCAKEMEKLTEEEFEEVIKIVQEIEDEEEYCNCGCKENAKNIPLVTEHLQGFGVNAEEFDKGIDDVSRICGQFSALKSVGMSDKDAMDVIVNLLTISMNRENIAGNIDIASIQDMTTRI